MFHSTTILAVRHRDHAVLAGDGQVTLRPDHRQAECAEDPAALQRPDSGGICRVGRRFVRAVRPVRVQARAVPRQPRTVGRRAREGLAKRPHPAAARGDADRARQERRRFCCPATAISSSRTMASWRSDRAGPTRWPRREALAANTELDARAIAEKAMAHRRRDLHLHEREYRASKNCRRSAHLPAGVHADLDRVADAAPDRRGARQVRHRPGGRQARRGHCAAQPHAAAEAVAGAGRGSRAEEHPDDRADRRRQDRNRPPARAARAVAVHQGRGVEVHRSRLRRPRRRVDGPRSRRARRRHGARGAARGSARKAAQNAEERLLDLLLPPTRPIDARTRSRSRARAAAADPRAVPRAAARRPSRHPRRRSRRAREIVSVARDHRGLVGRGSRHQPEGHAARALSGQDAQAAPEGARGARVPRRRKKSRS